MWIHYSKLSLFVCGIISLWSVTLGSIFPREGRLRVNYRRSPMPCPPFKCRNQTTDMGTGSLAECKCDTHCHLYGECCSDAPTANHTDFSAYPWVNCTSVPLIPNPIYTVSFCSSSQRPISARKCRSSANYTEQIRKPILKVPVTDPSTNVTYGNYECARCRNVTSYIFWSMRIVCPSYNKTIQISKDNVGPNKFFINYPELRETLKFDNESKVWKLINSTLSNQIENCVWIPVWPNGTDTSIDIRQCSKEAAVISDCGTSNDTKLEECPGFMARVNDGSTSYRNEQCGVCNGARSRDLSCGRISTRYLPLNWSPAYDSSFSIVSSTTTQTNTTLRVITTPQAETTTTVALTTPPIPDKKPNKKRAYMYIQSSRNCEQILSKINFTKVFAETIYYETITRSFVRSRSTVEGAAVQTCNMEKPITPIHFSNVLEEYWVAVAWFSFNYIVYCLLTFFAGFLNVMYLYMYCRSSTTLKTLYEKILFRCTLALFVANLGSFIDGIFTLKNQTSIHRFSVVYYIMECYGHAAARFWAVAMAFEMTCSVWDVAGGILKAAGEGKKRFIVYSLLIWVGLSVALFSKVCWGTYDSTICTFVDNQESHLYGTVAMNLAFYMCSFHVIQAQSDVLRKLSEEHGIDFSIYTILTVCNMIMDLSNIEELFVAAPSWVIFRLANCMVAFSIYMHAVVTNKYLEKFKTYINDKYYHAILLCK